MNASVAAPASSSDIVEARIASSRPDRVCISTTNGSIRASTSSGWWTTRSGPSAMIARSSSVTIVAISTITSLVWSSPVISRSIHTSTTADTTGGTMAGMDRAARFGRLLAEPGVVEHSVLRSPFGFMAYHGGALERQTDRIARAAADAAGASLYVVEHPPPDPAHFPSTDVRREESPALHEFFEHVDVVVTVHGYGRDGMFTSLLLGGRNRDLAARPRRRARRRPCPTTRSSPTSRRSPASCAASTPTTRSTSRPTAACRSSCRRASAGSARVGRLDRRRLRPAGGRAGRRPGPRGRDRGSPP